MQFHKFPILAAAVVCAASASLGACGQQTSTQGQASAPGRIAPAPPPPEGPRKDYLKSEQSDARRAEGSMPSPSGSQ
ncbi:MAG TPA: hypothetical protein VGL58_03995 [Caulobacteraceae bacterium]|jgi:hypothetical protein